MNIIDTPDPGHPMEKWLKHMKTSHTRESWGQPLPVGDYKAARNRQDSTRNTNSKRDPQKKQRIGTVSKNKIKLLEGLNMFDLLFHKNQLSMGL